MLPSDGNRERGNGEDLKKGRGQNLSSFSWRGGPLGKTSFKFHLGERELVKNQGDRSILVTKSKHAERKKKNLFYVLESNRTLFLLVSSPNIYGGK